MRAEAAQIERECVVIRQRRTLSRCWPNWINSKTKGTFSR